MEARINSAKDICFGLKEEIDTELKSTIENLIFLVKHECSDIRKEMSYLASKQDASEIKYEMKEAMKSLEMKMYSFIVKAVVTTIGIVSALQPVVNMIMKN